MDATEVRDIGSVHSGVLFHFVYFKLRRTSAGRSDRSRYCYAMSVIRSIPLLVLMLCITLAAVGAEARPLIRESNAERPGREAPDRLTGVEAAVVEEVNLVRSDPARYARTCLVPLRSYYRGRLLCYPGKIPVATTEGVAALDECIRVLQRSRPVATLSPSGGLSKAARDHALDQGRTGKTGHEGSDGSSMLERIERYGTWEGAAGENISYGFTDAREIVAALLIDDGVPSRGHRRNLLEGRFTRVGVGTGPHRVYRGMCVIDFAGGYTSR